MVNILRYLIFARIETISPRLMFDRSWKFSISHPTKPTWRESELSLLIKTDSYANHVMYEQYARIFMKQKKKKIIR